MALVFKVIIVMLAATFGWSAGCGGDDAPATTPGPTASPTPLPPSPGIAVKLTKVASGFTRPTFVTNAGDGSGRLFVVEKSGKIRIVAGSNVVAEAFLDITKTVRSSGNEQGLLGLAFHPQFKQNGRLFVAYTAQNGDNTVAEYRASPDLNRADAASGRVLFGVKDPFPNHNGGMLAFGKDGYLYVSMGDGGSGGDPNGNAQNLDSLLGKLLRIDVNSGEPYGIPKDNPYVGKAAARPEIWAFGLRNPWRFSFDRQTGDMWIADVGQNAIEEVDFQGAQSKGGENYGWRTMEGRSCFKPESNCDQSGLTLPIAQYTHDKGCSITGGYVYRGKAFPAFQGTYFYTDYCTGNFWSLRRDASGKATVAELPKVVGSVSSFGEDEAGEVYLVSDSEGTLYQLVGP